MPVKFNLSFKRFFLLFAISVIGLKLSAQQSYFYKPLKIETFAGEKRTIDFGREISSIVIDVSREEAFFGTAIYANGVKYNIFHDADAPDLQGKFRSNIIIFKQSVSSLLIETNSIEEITLHAIYVKPILFERNRKAHLKNDGCEKPLTIDQEIWRKDLPAPQVLPAKNKVKHIIIHHTATANSDTDYVKVMRNIYMYHTQVNGWDDIGYNFLIAPDGTIFQGRDGQTVDEDDNVTGAHFCGKNTGTMGISMIGTFSEITPTDTALNSLKNLIAWKLNKEGLNALDSALHPAGSAQAYYVGRISGHREGCATECPGDSLYVLLPEIRSDVSFLMKDCTPPLVSINSHSLNNEINIYPQPVLNFAYISCPENACSSARYVLTDMIGRNILSGEIDAGKTAIDVSMLKRGIYTVSIYTPTKKYLSRLIKQ